MFYNQLVNILLIRKIFIWQHAVGTANYELVSEYTYQRFYHKRQSAVIIRIPTIDCILWSP